MTGAGDSVPLAEVPVRDAATVMIVRPDPGKASGTQVLMLRRNLRSRFAGGAYVFPGGAVDAADGSPELAALCDGKTEEDANRHLGVESDGLAFFVAAVRETFEEAGLLLARTEPDAAGAGPLISFVPADDPTRQARFVRHRRSLNNRESDLLALCNSEGLRLALDGVEYFSHWITPKGAPRRFDTRFFVARAPHGQEALHDEGETVDSIWIAPHEALDRHAAGSLDLIFPTIKNLEAIARFASVDELLAAATRASAVEPMLPRVSVEGHGLRILLPGDPGYADADEDAGILEDMPLPGRPGGPLHY